MVIKDHRYSKSTSGAKDCLCFSPHENVIIFIIQQNNILRHMFCQGTAKGLFVSFHFFSFFALNLWILVFFLEKTQICIISIGPGSDQSLRMSASH